MYVRRGPIRSQRKPMSARTTTVIATEAIVRLPIWPLVRCNSERMTGISGASPNHPKKQMKKANHDMWNARIGTLEKSARRIWVALFLSVNSVLLVFVLHLLQQGA